MPTAPLAQKAHGRATRARRHFTRHRRESLFATQAHKHQVLGRSRTTPPPLTTGWEYPKTSPDCIRALPKPTPRDGRSQCTGTPEREEYLLFIMRNELREYGLVIA
jgi:hypothetical protein